MAEGSEYREKIAGFMSVTGENHDRTAQLYLESAEWDLQLALTHFYEDRSKSQPVKQHFSTSASTDNPRSPRLSTRKDLLRDLGTEERSVTVDVDDNDSRSLFAEGSEHSGLQIVGPSTNKIIEDLFKEATEHGAVPIDEATAGTEDPSRARAHRAAREQQHSSTQPFSGGGYRLGSSSQIGSEYVSEQYQPKDVQILLKLWRNGFSLDDGELRPYTEPENAQFLESVKKGEIPEEIQKMVHGGKVTLDMEDHQEHEYMKPKFKAFSGEGLKLGSLTPQIVSRPSSPEEEVKAPSNVSVVINDSEPTTNIQVRLADGSRLVQRFNLTHRVLDVRQFIIESRPNFAVAEFVLMTTFPSRELIEETQTLQQAKLINSVIVQRLKHHV